ncbi:GntR family transcriptional regulator [uncultured Anaerococcus sp.]|uniref:GntR family transcriptional regulator n=1 Tax=uncultured Anaerococcus sp. TaxID=293428 RepID=UPI002803EE13|nr:GntR family transcriptional regulator [uncultured Anaerococcus sp.]
MDTTPQKPLYKQIADTILEDLKKDDSNSEYQFLDNENKLPTERALADIFDVSRITIRKALALLEEENYVKRIQGKGTYYNKNKVLKPLKESKSFSKTVIDSGHMPGAKLLSASLKLANIRDQEIFGISKNDYVLVMKRLRYVDNIPASLEITHFNKDFIDLKDIDFNNTSLYEFLKKERGLTFSYLNKTIEIVYSDNKVSEIFGIDVGTPLVLLKALVVNQYGEVTHNVFEYLLSDKFIFSV